MQSYDAEASAEAARGFAALLRDLLTQAKTLLRQEMALLRAESREALGRIGQGLIALAAALFFVVSGWFALLAAAILGLATVLPAWLAALIVAAVLLAAGASLVAFARSRLALRSLVPRRTLDTLRVDRTEFEDPSR